MSIYVIPFFLIFSTVTMLLLIKEKGKIVVFLIIIIVFIAVGIIGIVFVPKMIRGQKLINEINNYYKINNEYPESHTTDKNEIFNVYKKAFPDEDIQIGEFTQPYYQEWTFPSEKYYNIYYILGYDRINGWYWEFTYSSKCKRWELGYRQY